MRRCPKCSATYDDTWKICLDCNAELAQCAPSAVDAAAADRAKAPSEKPYFKRLFDRFDSGERRISWNWPAAIFQLVWYAVKGMWPKAFLYGAILWLLQAVASNLDLYFLVLPVWACAFLYFGAFGNYDYYIYRKKEEFFWAGVPYKKTKIFFWCAISALVLYAAVYQGYVTTKTMVEFSRNAKPGYTKSLSAGGLLFDKVPGDWTLYKDPPQTVSLSISRPAGNGITESLSYKALRGTKFLGYIIGGSENNKVYKGLVAITEYKPLFGRGFASPKDKAAVDKALMYSGASKLPFYAKWLSFIKLNPSEPVYTEFSGRTWGHITNEMEINVAGFKVTVHISSYWTVNDGRLICVVGESFSPYVDDIRLQLEGFIRSAAQPVPS